MHRWVYRFISTLAVGGVVVAIALFAGPTGKRALLGGVGSAEAGGIRSCFPNDQFNEIEGPRFKSSGTGTAIFTEHELNGVDDNSGGRVIWSFLQVLTQDVGSSNFNDPYSGNFGGSLLITIFWFNGGVTTFVSECLHEVKTRGGSTLEAQVGAEGNVFNFPNFGGVRDASAALEMHRENPGKKVGVVLTITLGDRCNPGDELSLQATSVPGENEGFQESGVAIGVLKSPNTSAGAHSGCEVNDD